MAGRTHNSAWMRLVHGIRSAFVTLMMVVVVSSTALAQGTQPATPPTKSPLGIGPAPAARQATPPSQQSWWQQVIAAQQAYVREMGAQIKALKSDNPLKAAVALAGIAFLYGVLHAAGPGHGKAVISSYVLANRDTARRGIALSFLAAFFQACSAVLFVGILAWILRITATEMKVAEAWLERLSWLFVIGVGGWLLWRQIKPMLAAKPSPALGLEAAVASPRIASTPHVHADGTVCHHDHGHHHEHSHSHGRHVHADGTVCHHDHGHHQDHSGNVDPVATRHAHKPGAACNHVHEPGHVHGPDCGHAHMPAPQDLEGPWSWRRALAISLGIGMRPCTGAILLMVFALSQGLLWAGVFATFMMSLGTAITVSLLAVLAVTSRDFALRLTGGAESRWGQRLATGVGVVAAILVIGLGIAGLANPTPEPMFTTR
ncbi:MAG: nickel/cobalt transporter [Hyphomicrobiaceae bacterium]|nr:nickel/cobalt transporter [Hyphomicrobiaceae bacterium]